MKGRNFCHILKKKYSVDRCAICLKRFDTLLPEVNVLAKGLTNLIKISKERDMPALHKYLLHMRESNGRISDHHQCRRKFTDTRKKTQVICVLKSYDHLQMHLSLIGKKVAFFVLKRSTKFSKIEIRFLRCGRSRFVQVLSGGQRKEMTTGVMKLWADC